MDGSFQRTMSGTFRVCVCLCACVRVCVRVRCRCVNNPSLFLRIVPRRPPLFNDDRSTQELLDDLRQKFSVVREHSSWADDTNPFCCDRCLQGSSWSESAGGGQATTPPPDDDLDQEAGEAGTGGEDEAADACGNPRYAAPERPRSGEALALCAGRSSPEGNGAYGDVASQSSAAAVSSVDKAKRESQPPGLTGLLGSTGDDACTMAVPSRANEGAPETPGNDGAGTGPRQPQKADAVASALSAHMRGVDKYPLDLARLCRFSQFLTENELLREAYEVSLGIGDMVAVLPPAPG